MDNGRIGTTLLPLDERRTDTTENNTFPQLRWQAVRMIKLSRSHYRPRTKFWGKAIFSQVFVCPQGEGLPTGGGLHQGGLPGGSPSSGGGGPAYRGGLDPGRGSAHPPPELEKQTVRSLLECFLVQCESASLLDKFTLMCRHIDHNQQHQSKQTVHRSQ